MRGGGVRGFSRTAARSARQRVGLTQADLAQLIGVTDGIISAWESGTRAPVARNLVALARELRTPPIELLNIGSDDLRLPEFRALQGLTGVEAAALVGVGVSTFYDIERGERRPTARTREAIAQLYKISETMVDIAWQRGHDHRLETIRRAHPGTS